MLTNTYYIPTCLLDYCIFRTSASSKNGINKTGVIWSSSPTIFLHRCINDKPRVRYISVLMNSYVIDQHKCNIVYTLISKPFSCLVRMSVFFLYCLITSIIYKYVICGIRVQCQRPSIDYMYEHNV